MHKDDQLKADKAMHPAVEGFYKLSPFEKLLTVLSLGAISVLIRETIHAIYELATMLQALVSLALQPLAILIRMFQ